MFKLQRIENILIYGVVNPQIRRLISKYARGRMLDVGCGDKPYADMAAPHVSEHVGADHDETQHDKNMVDSFCAAVDLAFDDESFDTVLCTYVLEHVAEPAAAVAEARRVLKPGGYALYAVPLFWHEHEAPHDYYRFTQFGLRRLFENAGFEIAELIGISGFFVTFTQELVYMLYKFRRGGPLNPLWWLIPPAAILMQLAAMALNAVEMRLGVNREYTMEYLVAARKPAK